MTIHTAVPNFFMGWTAHGSYEFQLNADGTDYDWDHAANTETGRLITLSPEDGDEEAKAALEGFPGR